MKEPRKATRSSREECPPQAIAPNADDVHRGQASVAFADHLLAFPDGMQFERDQPPMRAIDLEADDPAR